MKKYFFNNKRALSLFLITNFISAFLSIALAFILEEITKAALSMDMQRAIYVIIATLIYIIADASFDFLASYSNAKLKFHISYLLRHDLIRRIEKLSLQEVEIKGGGYYLSKINNDVKMVEDEYVGSICGIVNQIFCLIFALIASFYIQPVLSAIVIAISICPILFPKITEKPLQRAEKKVVVSKSAYTSIITEILSGFLTLQLFRGFSNINRKHDEKNEALRETQIKAGKINRFVISGAYGLGNIIYLGTWALGLLFVILEKITFPELVALTQLMSFVAGPIQIISERYASLVSTKAVAIDLQDFISSGEDKKNFPTKEIYKISDIAAHNISYRSNDRQVLNQINLSFHIGQRIAVLGESGSGKSTLLQVLCGVLPVTEGVCTINGIPQNEYKKDSIWKKISFITQHTTVFTGSIKDNVTVFEENDDKNVWEALSKAGLENWVQSQNDGIYTQVNSDGIKMSGGEERRLDMARVFLRDTDAIFMDEPLTGLDLNNISFLEEKILALRDKLIVVVMHNLHNDFLAKFDQIIVMKDGKVAFCGNYSEFTQTPFFDSLIQK